MLPGRISSGPLSGISDRSVRGLNQNKQKYIARNMVARPHINISISGHDIERRRLLSKLGLGTLGCFTLGLERLSCKFPDALAVLYVTAGSGILIRAHPLLSAPNSIPKAIRSKTVDKERLLRLISNFNIFEP